MEQSTTATQHTGGQTQQQVRPDPYRGIQDDAPQQPPTITQTADNALQSVSVLYQAVDGALQHQLRESPYRTLAAAAGVGFVLGGGLRSPVGQLLMRLSIRTFGPQVLNATLQAALERATGSVGPATHG